MIRCLAGLVLALALPSAGAATPPTVIVLSWDGVRHDQPARATLPGLARMSRDGARAERLVPVFPSNTFPNHVSLATGTYPDRHGIVDNRFRDRARGLFDYSNDASWIEAEPLWVAAERQGVPAAVYFWVGSETDWRGLGARHRKAPFDSRVGEQEKVEQILAWLNLPDGERPRLVMSWWRGADRVGHAKGPDHADVSETLAAQDRHLRTLLAALDARAAWEHTTLLVVSDHGMTTAGAVIPVEAKLREAGVVASVERGTALAHVFLDDPVDLGRAEAALDELEGARVHPTLPPAWRLAHPRRTGDLVVEALPPRFFRRRGPPGLGAALLGWKPGIHGYAPDHPDMAGVLFALGRGVSPGTRLGVVRAIDVAPSVARLLGIDPPAHSEGHPIPGILDGERDR